MLPRSRSRHTVQALLLAVCLSVTPAPAPAVMDDMFAVMFRMMLVMMNVMSNSMLNNNNWGNNWNGLNAFNLGMSGAPAFGGFANPWQGYGFSPWQNHGGMPWQPGWGNRWDSGYPGGYGARYGDIPAPYPALSLLEGRWIGNSGELLEIRGDRFLLRTPGAALDGQLSVERNLLSMYSPQTNTVTRYTFARSQYELVLNNGSAVLVFRDANYLPY